MNTMMFVALHELGHLMTKEIGHVPPFWANFKFLIKVAIHLKVYKYTDFNKKPEPKKIKKNQINQLIISQIRDFKDKQANIYKKNKEYNEQLKQLYIKRMQQQQQQQLNQMKQQENTENKELKHLDSIKEIYEDDSSDSENTDSSENTEKININI